MLPARVRERVRAQEERSEILVGIVQLAFIAGMALLYALSPKKFGAEAPFAPVPWVLGAYCAFTLARLALALAKRPAARLRPAVDRRRHRAAAGAHLQLPPPVRAAAVVRAQVADVHVAVRADRAAHAQLRGALRRPAAGFVAAAGWVALVVYVVTIDPRDPHGDARLRRLPDVEQRADRRRGRQGRSAILVFTAVLALATGRGAAPGRRTPRSRRPRRRGPRPLRAARRSSTTARRTAEDALSRGPGRDRRRPPCCSSTSRASPRSRSSSRRTSWSRTLNDVLRRAPRRRSTRATA
ncbi:MAG: hypothetical protein MZW92_32365 [Comamonadaceae bacterium]|nr:hypothetical protein [Comamonadaceae bacterium]